MEGINLKKMSNEELNILMMEIRDELKKRTETFNVLYTHDCKGRANNHMQKYKHWAKLVTEIRPNALNGYAFGGDFLNVNQEHYVPKGSVVVEVCGRRFMAYKVTGDNEKMCITSAEKDCLSGFINRVKEEMEVL